VEGTVRWSNSTKRSIGGCGPSGREIRIEYTVTQREKKREVCTKPRVTKNCNRNNQVPSVAVRKKPGNTQRKREKKKVTVNYQGATEKAMRGGQQVRRKKKNKDKEM